MLSLHSPVCAPQIKIEFEIDPNARLSDPAPPRSPGGRIGAHERLEQQQRELAALDLDVREEALQGKLERAERNAARSRDASSSPRSSHSGRSRSRSRGSRSPSRSRSRSRSPLSSADNSSRRPDSSRGGEEEF